MPEIIGITYRIYISVKIYLLNKGVSCQKSPGLPIKYIFQLRFICKTEAYHARSHRDCL